MKAVFFDLDNTLYSYDNAHAAAYDVLHRRAEMELSLSPTDFDSLHTEANRILSVRCGGGAAIHDRLLRYQIMMELTGLPIANALWMANCYWSVFLNHLQPEPGARKTLEQLRSRGIQVGVGTNMTADYQFEKLRRLELLPLVDLLVTSEEVNAEKPDSRFFLLCAEKAKAAPSECCFVGDSLEKDAVAASGIGMRGLWYVPNAPSEKEQSLPVLRRLEDLISLL